VKEREAVDNIDNGDGNTVNKGQGRDDDGDGFDMDDFLKAGGIDVD